MAEARQIADRVECGGDVVDADDRRVDAGDPLADDDHRIVGDRPLARRERKKAVEQDDAVGALTVHESPIGLGDGAVDAGVADQHRHVVAARLFLDSLQQHGKEWIGDVGQQHDDEAAAFAAQSAGVDVDGVVEPPRRRLDPARQTGRHFGRRRQGPRDGGERHSREVGDVLHGRLARASRPRRPAAWRLACPLPHLPPRAVGSLARISVELNRRRTCPPRQAVAFPSRRGLTRLKTFSNNETTLLAAAQEANAAARQPARRSSAGGALEVERWWGNDRAISSTICRVAARRRSVWAPRGGRDDASDRGRRCGTRRCAAAGDERPDEGVRPGRGALRHQPRLPRRRSPRDHRRKRRRQVDLDEDHQRSPGTDARRRSSSTARR